MEQVGTPVQIYNYPQTEFVAQFVGQLNLLPVTAVDPKGGFLSVGWAESAIRPFVRANADGQPRLAIRPEELRNRLRRGTEMR